MSSGASSSSQRATLIHKQLPLSLARCRCRFRTAVPPNISLPCLADGLKKPGSMSASSERGEKRATTRASQQEKKKRGGKRAQIRQQQPRKTSMQYSAFYVNERAGRHTSVSVNGRGLCLCKAIPGDGTLSSNEEPAG